MIKNKSVIEIGTMVSGMTYSHSLFFCIIMDFNKIEKQLENKPVIQVASYLSAFGKNEPEKYKEYLKWRKENNLQSGCINYNSFQKGYWKTDENGCSYNKDKPHLRYCH